MSTRRVLFDTCIAPKYFRYCIVQTFDRPLCVRQLRYSGMMETIRIRRAGYPIRHTFADFVERYRVLCPRYAGIPYARIGDMRRATSDICEKVFPRGSPAADYQLGKTKVFLKDAHDSSLQVLREKAFHRHATLIQKTWRGFRQRRRYERIRRAALVIKRFYRAFKDRIRFLRVRFYE